MKSRFATSSAAAVLAASLLLAPGLSPAQASENNAGGPAIIATPGGEPAGRDLSSGPIASPTGIWFLPCDFMGLVLCNKK